MFVFVVPTKDKAIFDSHLAMSLKRVPAKVMCIGDEQENNKNTVQEKYFKACEIIKKENVASYDDLVVFCHEDVNILDMEFQQKIEYVFNQRSDIGILGVVGSKSIDKSNLKFDVGHFIQGNNSSPGAGSHVDVGSGVGFYDDVVAVDRSFFVVRASMILNGDVTFKDIPDYDVYPFVVSLQCLKAGFSVCVADILIYHKSQRYDGGDQSQITSSFESYFESLSKDGYEFPITTNNFKSTQRNNVIEVEI